MTRRLSGVAVLALFVLAPAVRVDAATITAQSCNRAAVNAAIERPTPATPFRFRPVLHVDERRVDQWQGGPNSWCGRGKIEGSSKTSQSISTGPKTFMIDAGIAGLDRAVPCCRSVSSDQERPVPLTEH